MRVGYLARSVIGAGAAANALRPMSASVAALPAFFPGWLTSELAPQLIAAHAADSAWQIARGRTRTRAGRAGLVLSAGAIAGLAMTTRRALGARAVVDDVLEELTDATDAPDATHAAAAVVPRPWRQIARPFRLRRVGVRRTAGLSYGPAGFRNRLDVYAPVEAAPGDRRPVLVQIHGGAWVVGRKDQQGLPTMFERAAAGWVCVAPNYRLSPRATWPDQLVDVKRALAWVREHIDDFGGDPDFVAATGGSAGGHLAAMVALTANDPAYQPGFEQADTTVQACVPHYGVYDLANTAGDKRARVRTHFLSRAVLKRPVSDTAAFEAASPLCLVDAAAPPFFILHGSNDTLVPVAEARRFVARLRATSRQRVLYAELPGTQHAYDVFHSIRSTAVIAAVGRFLDWAYTDATARPAPPRPGDGTADRQSVAPGSLTAL